MPFDRRPVPSNIRFATGVLRILVAALVVGTAGLVGPTISRASPITYVLSDATATFVSLVGKVTLTGSFIFDPASTTCPQPQGGPCLDGLNIKVSGPTDILTVSPETFSALAADGPAGISAENFMTQDQLGITFLNPLGNEPDPITAVVIEAGSANTCGGEGGCASVSVTGSASPVELEPVPEPPTLALLGAALGIFLISQRASRRARQPHRINQLKLVMKAGIIYKNALLKAA
jgi:hypothetical protein